MTTRIEPPPARKVACQDCRHFHSHPYGDGTPWKRKTGCYHPELMEQKQSERFLFEQQVPGDHEKLNARGDCAKFEPRPRRRPLLQRMLLALLS